LEKIIPVAIVILIAALAISLLLLEETFIIHLPILNHFLQVNIIT